MHRYPLYSTHRCIGTPYTPLPDAYICILYSMSQAPIAIRTTVLRGVSTHQVSLCLQRFYRWYTVLTKLSNLKPSSLSHHLTMESYASHIQDKHIILLISTPKSAMINYSLPHMHPSAHEYSSKKFSNTNISSMRTTLMYTHTLAH